jgi:hypothetical protein
MKAQTEMTRKTQEAGTSKDMLLERGARAAWPFCHSGWNHWEPEGLRGPSDITDTPCFIPTPLRGKSNFPGR